MTKHVVRAGFVAAVCLVSNPSPVCVDVRFISIIGVHSRADCPLLRCLTAKLLCVCLLCLVGCWPSSNGTANALRGDVEVESCCGAN